MEEKKIKLNEKIRSLKKQIETNSKDAHFAKALVDELLTTKSQLCIEPIELNVGKKIDEFRGETFTIVKTNRGCLYHEYGGYSIFATPAQNALYTTLVDYIDNKEIYSTLKGEEKEIFDLIQQECNRQNEGIELIASENYASKVVRDACGSILTNKYAEGYPNRRYYGGCKFVDLIENIAIEKACELFGAKYANVQPHSGSQANAAAYHALLPSPSGYRPAWHLPHRRCCGWEHAAQVQTAFFPYQHTSHPSRPSTQSCAVRPC